MALLERLELWHEWVITTNSNYNGCNYLPILIDIGY